MGGLNTALNIGISGLDAAQGALDATSNNIANVNTPGYTREVPQLTEDPVTVSGAEVSGGGVSLQGLQSVQDELLDLQIQQQTSLQNSVNTESSSLTQVQTFFSNTGADIASELTAFSSSLTALSANSTNTAAQQSVLASGQDLASSFNTTANGLISAQSAANGTITQSVSQINTLTAQIAQLNGQMSQLTASGQDDGSTQDALNQAVQQLSGLTGISVTQSSDGESITTGNGTPLVVGTQSFNLQTTTGSNGTEAVLDSSGNNITASITGGDLGGAIQVSTVTIPGYLTQLNTLATQVATAFNGAQAQGTNSNGSTGTNFFSLPTNSANPAAGISVALTSPSQIAVSSDGSAGSNGNIANLAAVLTNPLPTNSATSTQGTASAPLSTSTALTLGSVTSVTDAATGQTFKYTAGVGATIGSLQTAIAGAVTAGTLSAGTALTINSSGQAVISTSTSGDILQVSSNASTLGSFSPSTASPTASTAYANMVFEVGNATANASSQSTAIGLNLSQLTNQQGSVSAVSIDEETTNLISYQTAYEAASRIVSTVQALSTAALNMGSGTSF
jgi:flagellar hook-associated protein 1 FlgK